MSTRFAYTARMADGTLVRGSMQSADKETALAFLRTRALFITSLRDERSPAAALGRLSLGSVRKSQLVASFRALAALVAAGVSLRRALEVTIEQTARGRLQEALRSIAHAIENGLPLSQALAQHPAEFSALQVVMIRAGEVGGALDTVLLRLADSLERERAIYKRLTVALAYPAFVSCAAVALMMLLLTSVLPMFASLYTQMRVPMPPLMTGALAVAAFLESPMLLVAIAAVGSISVAVLARFNIAGARRVQWLALRLPLAGALVRKAHLARIARMLGTLLRSGVGVVPAMDVVQDAMVKNAYHDSIVAIRRALDSGLPLSGPMDGSVLYDPLFVQMVKVGEETGTLDEMLSRIADYYDLDLETAISSMTALVEPALLLVIGSAVAGLAATVFIPLYSLIGSIR